MKAIPIAAKLLSPFYYHGLYAFDGSATHPGVITDTAIVFALQQALYSFSPKLRHHPNYLEDMRNLPWRASLLIGAQENQMMFPVRHTIDLTREGGYQDKLQRCIGSGNFKNTFFVHEVAAGAQYQGLLYGPNPFTYYGTKTIIVRIGVGRLGMLELKKAKQPDKIRLNTQTAAWFGRSLPEDYRILDSIRVSHSLTVTDATHELAQWV